MLEVKYEHDVQQQDPIRYKGFDIDGSLLHIQAEAALGPEHQSGRKNDFQRVSSHVATDSNKRDPCINPDVTRTASMDCCSEPKSTLP
jgi:hypothetical protein